jgi:lipopolysaccharide/colanic/teichoic acid biosynthesis glycosyltransferase
VNRFLKRTRDVIAACRLIHCAVDGDPGRAIRLSPPPGAFVQMRAGERPPFKIIKFRTMVEDAESTARSGDLAA